MKTRKHNEEVLYCEDQIVRVNRQDIEQLKEDSNHTQRERMRLCAHRDTQDSLHEMLIVHKRNTYVRPHKHLKKIESFHIIEGEADIVLLDDQKNIIDVIEMGDYASGKSFYYRLADPYYHTLIIKSEIIVFHEITNGPFVREDTLFAPWAPEEGDREGVAKFMNELIQEVEK